MQRVLLASPVKQQKEILREFLESIKNLDRSGLKLDLALSPKYS